MGHNRLGNLSLRLARSNMTVTASRLTLPRSPGMNTSPRRFLKPLLTLQQVAVSPLTQPLAHFVQ